MPFKTETKIEKYNIVIKYPKENVVKIIGPYKAIKKIYESNDFKLKYLKYISCFFSDGYMFKSELY